MSRCLTLSLTKWISTQLSVPVKFCLLKLSNISQRRFCSDAIVIRLHPPIYADHRTVVSFILLSLRTFLLLTFITLLVHSFIAFSAAKIWVLVCAAFLLIFIGIALVFLQAPAALYRPAIDRQLTDYGNNSIGS